MILHNSFAVRKRKKEQKRLLQAVGGSVFLLVSVGFIFSSGKLAESTDQNELREELQANADLLDMQNGDTNQGGVSYELKSGESSKNSQEYEPGKDVLFIGDSVMLGAVSEMQNAIPDCIVEAAESRQVWGTAEIVSELKKEERLGDCVVVGLGSNGSFDERSGQELIDAIGADRKIYWISVYGQYMTWQESVNDMIYRLADKNENMTVIDWAGFAKDHSEWFYNDGLHLNGDGQIAYAGFLNENVFDLEN